MLLSLGYFYIFWDRRREDSGNRDDGQVGLKLVLYTLLVLSLGIAAGAFEQILGYLLSGAKNQAGAKGSGPLKMGIASLVAGGVGIAVIFFLFLPRTNAKEYPQSERFAWGLVAFLAGMATIIGLGAALRGVFGELPGWPAKAHALARLLVAGGLAFWSITRFGALSGWQSVERGTAAGVGAGVGQPGYQAQPQGGYQPQQGGYQPQQGGYQPQQGGYQPQQGGYQPPQQGGYQPPQQGGGGLPSPGGYPPQGGGYPPR
ncbi:MAG: hypothetical protein Tsb0020_51400 [Haliangiales bacterium]